MNANTSHSQNDASWQENVQAAKPDAPYLVSYYVDGIRPNYSLALEHGGFDPTTKVFPAMPGEVIDIVWENDNGVSGGFDYHPMHIHGEHVFDLGCGNGTYNAALNEARFLGGFVPARRDTTILHRYTEKGVPGTTAGWRAWRIRITEENVGVWMMHCHIAQHAVMGMNTVWVFGDEEDILQRFPHLPYRDGYLEYGGSAYGNSDHPAQVDHWFGDSN